MNRLLGLSVLLIALCLPAPLTGAATIYVSASAPPGGDGTTWDTAFDTIQAGIDAADDGDEVLVADGTYTGDGNRDLDFGGKPITVRSASGDAALCVIDCEGTEENPHRGFYFHSGETADSVIDGLTICRGYCSSGGAGISCVSSNPTLVNCSITGNTSDDFGGGMLFYQSNPIVVSCTISENTAGLGGGLCCMEDSSPALTNCAISQNTAEMEGGGVFCGYGSHPFVANCTVSQNTARGGGGVSCTSDSHPVLANCAILQNVAGYGGAVCCFSKCSPMLTNCRTYPKTGQLCVSYTWTCSSSRTNNSTG